MILSGRRKQFLQKIIDLYKKTNVPVHYETLAKVIGVSKWTAYDMMMELEKNGYLIRGYSVNPGEKGRSQVVFQPSTKATNLFDFKHSDNISQEEWNKIKKNIYEFLNNKHHYSFRTTIEKMLEEISKVQVQISFSAYIIGLFLVYLKNIGGEIESLIKRMVHNAPTNEMGVTMFVGTVVGTIIQTMNHEIGIETTDLVVKFLKTINDLSEDERRMLSHFLNEALA
ncbi:Lrp/AsnC family transcriptional regulator [Tepidibacillus fermentans]|uniref:Heat-inducible transcription repressor HrcA n=1 Tax=Tepidibacillus fermentans TaxID=1281767 RepID=A0A4R3KHL4_9BACI|nr:Lrp/AsnC family transcriptional regulator [Tepidibacillus fermentans]TCS82529.1 heat-inducible transcription repressor HrcA [Tepidibacillus fermentans]